MRIQDQTFATTARIAAGYYLTGHLPAGYGYHDFMGLWSAVNSNCAAIGHPIQAVH